MIPEKIFEMRERYEIMETQRAKLKELKNENPGAPAELRGDSPLHRFDTLDEIVTEMLQKPEEGTDARTTPTLSIEIRQGNTSRWFNLTLSKSGPEDDPILIATWNDGDGAGPGRFQYEEYVLRSELEGEPNEFMLARFNNLNASVSTYIPKALRLSIPEAREHGFQPQFIQRLELYERQQDLG